VLATRYGVSTETVRKWRRRGPEDCADHSSRPRRLPWKATEAERAIVCAVREATRFPLDDLTFALRHFLPHLSRDSLYRILKSEGLHRLADLPALYPDERPRRGQGHFRARWQRVLHDRSPADVVRRRLRAKLDLANPSYQPPHPDVMPNALLAVERAKNLSHGDGRLPALPGVGARRGSA
jgi:hypothetical protein